MRTRLLAGLVATALALAACGGSDDGGAETSAAPADLLSFEAETVAGDTIDVGDFAGSDLVIWFWAPW